MPCGGTLDRLHTVENSGPLPAALIPHRHETEWMRWLKNSRCSEVISAKKKNDSDCVVSGWFQPRHMFMHHRAVMCHLRVLLRVLLKPQVGTVTRSLLQPLFDTMRPTWGLTRQALSLEDTDGWVSQGVRVTYMKREPNCSLSLFPPTKTPF